jgi:hypothetical protein
MQRLRLLIPALALALAGLLAVHNVPDGATAEDQAYADRILAAAGLNGGSRDLGDLSGFESQIRAIATVQDAVLRVAASDEEIPFGQTREPRDVYEQKRGLCYDRSRAIEKMLGALGLETRHVAVYETAALGTLLAILKPRTPSHAVTEVKTEKGWLVVDPNRRWMSLTVDRRPLSVAGLRALPQGETQWAPESTSRPTKIFLRPYTFVRGLYSRHGMFYPPFTPVPDVNWRQLLQNFSE